MLLKFLSALCLVLSCEAIVMADEYGSNAPEDSPEEEIIITAERTTTASSDQTVRDRDIKFFPLRTASDLMRLVPGLHLTQHTGGAKAHQFFLRGFDAEHGQDLAVFLDGIPLNEISHVHGQGYLDLHFLIPEALERIRIIKGPYDVRLGNLATAGAIRIESRNDLGKDRLRVKVTGGQFGTWGLLGQVFLGEATRGSYLAVAGNATDGFTHPGDMNALRTFAHSHWLEKNGWKLDAIYAGYRSRSAAADTLPKDLIEAGLIDRFSALDDSNRVDVDRHVVGLSLNGPAAAGEASGLMYYNYKDTRIFSNYTFYYFDEIYGDQLEQSDSRHYAGGQFSWASGTITSNLGIMNVEAGLQWRTDAVLQAQARTVRRVRVNVFNSYNFLEHNGGVYCQGTLILGPRWMLVGGLRYDLQLVDLTGTQDVKEFNIYTNVVEEHNDQPREALTFAHILSPKLSAVFEPHRDWKLFFNFGRGFDTRPARDQAAESRRYPVAVTGAETGVRWQGWERRLLLAGSLWWAHKNNEWIFDSEFGGTVERGQSHRLGLELETRLSPREWIWLATDVFFTFTRLQQERGWDWIPNTPVLTMTNVAALQHPAGLYACLRGRLLGPRPHDLGLWSDAYYLVDAVFGWEERHWQLQLDIENLFNVKWYDSVFAYPVRIAPGAEINSGLQVTPGTPFFARLSLTAKW